ncbi:hypothetical protein MHD_09415 [Mannheimia granulomatis]|uniref:Uncharacterized protein n=1 Tax=Mannheimia granulomatis TaxID=85402 RepID=A0A011LZH5_9PAST|nr:hypothetical protein AK33_04260 [Mannheimia granulomatis]RGE47474.1 hypothetical protein MHD_09415 [Mannheimia granulomatis]
MHIFKFTVSPDGYWDACCLEWFRKVCGCFKRIVNTNRIILIEKQNNNNYYLKINEIKWTLK